jgi:hypothetical protein
MAATTTAAPVARNAALAPLSFASDITGRATLVALLTYFAPDRLRLGRSALAREIGGRIANLILEFGPTDANSWNVVGGNIEPPNGAPAKAGPTPNVADWDETYEVTSSAQKIAAPLEHYNGHTPWQWAHHERGTGHRENGNAVFLLHDNFPGYWVDQSCIAGGATCKTITDKLPRAPEIIAWDDVTLCFCMLNAVKGDMISKFSEKSTLGQEVIELCNRLDEFHRPMRCIGGASDHWKYNNPGWDALVDKMVSIARSMGIPTITGERHLKYLHYGPSDNEHCITNDHSKDVYMQWFQELRNAAYRALVSNSRRCRARCA